MERAVLPQALNKGAETYLKAQRDLAGKIERLTAAERDLVREHQDVTQRITPAPTGPAGADDDSAPFVCRLGSGGHEYDG